MKSHNLTQLKKKTDLVAVAQARGLALTKQGQDFVARCPFHEEATPSFHITPSKNLFHCFGCGAAGSVLDFVMRMDGIPFKAAVDKLLTETGVVQRATETPPPAEAPAPALAPERAAMLLARVTAIYEKTLAEMPEGRAYLEKRGITDAALWSRHRIGYSNGKLIELLPKEGPVWDELKTLGILLPTGQERFAGCVVFPVFDAEGNLTTIYGRFTGQGDKRHLYLPGRPTGLWNAVALKTYGHVVFVESILDGLSVEMAGSQNVISIQGTNGLNAGDVETFASYGVQRVTLLMDGDEPGRTATGKLQTLLGGSPQGPFSCQSRELPQDHDPNSYLLAHGAKALACILAEAGTSTRRRASRATATGRTDHPAQSPPGVQAIPGGFAVTLGGPCGLHRRYEIRGLEKGPRKLKVTVRVEHAGKLHVDTLDLYSPAGAGNWPRTSAACSPNPPNPSKRTLAGSCPCASPSLKARPLPWPRRWRP